MLLIHSQGIRTGFFFFSLLLILHVALAVHAGETQTQRLTVTVQANWTGCDGNCDSRQSGNHINSGGYTIHIKGKVKTKRGRKDSVNYEPESLTGTCFIHSTTNSISEDCQKCNPVEVIQGHRHVAFGREKNAIASMQAFMGKVGAAFALQLAGGLGENYAEIVPSLKDRKIISFSASGPATLKMTKKNCRTCASETETGEGGYAVSIIADMSARKSGSASWKSKAHPLDTLGASVIDLGGEQKVGPERNQKEGKAQYNVTWSLGEDEPAILTVKKIYFNYDSNKETALQLKSEMNDSNITAPEWTYLPDSSKPAAFVRDSAFKVKALFGVKGKRIKKAEIWAEEEVVHGGKESVKKGFNGTRKTTVSFSPGEKEKEVELTVRAPQSVISMNQVKWFWKANIWYEGSDEPQEMAIKTEGSTERDYTEHTIYIVGGKPVPWAKAYVFVVRKGCQWAEGKSDRDQAFKDIWDNFWDIHCPEGNRCADNPTPGIMAYFHDKAPGNLLGLLQQGRGTCGAWQKFFTAVTGCQGIVVDEHTVCPKKDVNPDTMKEEKNIVCMIAWPGQAQGNPSPTRIFFDHAINQYKGKLYDPSYHTVFPIGPVEPVSLFENETFSAYCVEKVPNLSMCLPFEKDRSKFEDCLEKTGGACHRNHPLECEVFLTPGKCPK